MVRFPALSGGSWYREYVLEVHVLYRMSDPILAEKWLILSMQIRSFICHRAQYLIL